MITRALISCLALLGVGSMFPQIAGPGRAQAAAGASQCHTAQLRGFIGGQNAGAGNLYTTLVLRNVGPGACTLMGYPGVSLVDRLGRQIGQPARWDAGVVRVVVLRPGGAASTTVHTLNPGVGTTDCLPPSTALRVYPPNERTSLLVPARLSDCLGVVGVKPFVAGMNGL